MKDLKVEEVIKYYDDLKPKIDRLIKRVYRSIKDKETLSDLIQDGINSGVVGEYIYYTDTVRFAHLYQKEIKSLLVETAFQSRQTVVELINSFRDAKNFDEMTIYRYLGGTRNKKEDCNFTLNVFCWFAVEEIANRMYEMLYEKGKL